MIGRPISSSAPVFGDSFRDGLLALRLHQWAVLKSTEGWHVVWLDSRRPGEPAKFDDVSDTALKTYQTDRARAWEAVRRLRTTYDVRYEP